MPFFPHEHIDWEQFEPAFIRRLSLSLVFMALFTGALLRVYRVLVLGVPMRHPAAVVAAYLAGIALLAVLVTLHLGNFPLRQWTWRAPAFAAVQSVASLAVSSLMVALGMERFGSTAMGWAQWRTDVPATVLRNELAVCGYALLLAGAVTIVRRLLIRRAQQEQSPLGESP